MKKYQILLCAVFFFLSCLREEKTSPPVQAVQDHPTKKKVGQKKKRITASKIKVATPWIPYGTDRFYFPIRRPLPIIHHLDLRKKQLFPFGNNPGHFSVPSLEDTPRCILRTGSPTSRLVSHPSRTKCIHITPSTWINPGPFDSTEPTPAFFIESTRF